MPTSRELQCALAVLLVDQDTAKVAHDDRESLRVRDAHDGRRAIVLINRLHVGKRRREAVGHRSAGRRRQRRSHTRARRSCTVLRRKELRALHLAGSGSEVDRRPVATTNLPRVSNPPESTVDITSSLHGPTDKAPDYGSGDWEFESPWRYTFSFSLHGSWVFGFQGASFYSARLLGVWCDSGACVSTNKSRAKATAAKDHRPPVGVAGRSSR